MDVLVKQLEDYSSKITINVALAEELGIQLWRHAILRLGFKVVEAIIEISPEVEENNLWLSNDLIEELLLPLECTYEIKIQNGEIHLGPFIGILAAKNDENLIKRFKWLGNYVWEYEQIKGVIFGFSYESIDQYQMKVTGYLYDPINKKWQERTIGFPSALYINAELDKKEREYLRSLYGSRLFNYKILNKWEIHQLLSTSNELEPYLPNTTVYDDPQILIGFLHRYNNVYVKPILGYGGKGIMKFSKLEGELLLEYRENDVNREIAFSNQEVLESYLVEMPTMNHYIVQQGLELKLMDNRVIDFRVALNKDGTGVWKTSGIVARMGSLDSIVSNFSSGGIVDTFEHTLQDQLDLDQNTVERIKEEIHFVAHQTIQYLEKSGQYFGKLAIDIAIDQNFKLWLIEVNNRSPNDFLFSHAGDWDTTFQIKLDNMMYAKWLAGFGEKNEK